MAALVDLVFVALVCLTTALTTGHIARPRKDHHQ